MSEPTYPVWCRRHHKTVRVLDTPAAVVAARLDELRMRRHDDGPTPTVEVNRELSNSDERLWVRR